ncbi:MAG: hypothetical protein DRN04_03955 [Thermoprotei archaeon]|nr:MAG: hypothetical protein DRN04_03955 [Thermoprotei archaeon]
MFENLIVASENGHMEYDLRVHLADLSLEREDYSEKLAGTVVSMLLQLCRDLGIEQEGKLEIGDKSFYFSRRNGGLALVYFLSKTPVSPDEINSFLKELLALRKEVYSNGGKLKDLRREINKFLVYYMGVHNYSLLYFKNTLMAKKGIKSIIVYYKNKVSIDGVNLGEGVQRSIIKLIRKIQSFWDLSIDFVKARINNSNTVIVYVSKDFYLSLLYDEGAIDLNTLNDIIIKLKKRLCSIKKEPIRITSSLMPIYEKILENYKLIDPKRASELLSEDIKKLVFEECFTLKEALSYIESKGGFPVSASKTTYIKES